MGDEHLEGPRIPSLPQRAGVRPLQQPGVLRCCGHAGFIRSGRHMETSHFFQSSPQMARYCHPIARPPSEGRCFKHNQAEHLAVNLQASLFFPFWPKAGNVLGRKRGRGLVGGGVRWAGRGMRWQADLWLWTASPPSSRHPPTHHARTCVAQSPGQEDELHAVFSFGFLPCLLANKV